MASTGAASDYAEFTTPPSAPSITALRPDADKRSVELVWTPCSGASKYEVAVSSASGFLSFDDAPHSVPGNVTTASIRLSGDSDWHHFKVSASPSPA